MKIFTDYYFKEYSDYEYIFADDIDYADEDKAYKMAKKFGISILSDKDIYVIIKDEDEIVGALWTAWNYEEFSFDIVVNPKYQGMGIGKKLVDIVISTFEQDKEAFGDDAIIRADVVNQDVMVPLLLKKGFEIESKSPGHTMMVRK